MASPVVKAEKSKLDDLCDQVCSRDDERIVFEHRGKKFALLTFEEFDFFEVLEDKWDNEAADAAIAESKAKGEKPIPWEVIKKKYGFEE